MNRITFWQYVKLNKQTTLSCLKISSILFAGIATAIALVVKYSKGSAGDPLQVFIVSELFGYGLGIFIFILAIFEGFTKARMVIGQYNKIPDRVRKDYEIKLVKRPLNPKYWFTQFQILQEREGEYYELDERTRKKTVILRPSGKISR